MAGPKVMALGPFQFEAMGFSYQDRARADDTAWAEIDIAGGQNALQWTGGKKKTETIKGVLFDEFGGQGALEGLKLAAATGQVLPLVNLGGAPFNIFGMHVVESISEDLSYVDADGAPRKNAYQIKIRAYRGGMGGGIIGSVLSLFG